MDILSDERFAVIAKDPRFREVPKQERKVKIDKRFQGMFTDKRFKLKYSVDKRGRPDNKTAGENLRKFYDLGHSDDDSDEDDNVKIEKVHEATGQSSHSPERENSTLGLGEDTKNRKRRRQSGREVLLAFKMRKNASPRNASKNSNFSTQANIRRKSGINLADPRGQGQDNRRQSHSNTFSSDDEDDTSDGEGESSLGSDDNSDDNLQLMVIFSDSNRKSDVQGSLSWQKQHGIDLARGEGNVETSSSESDSDDDDHPVTSSSSTKLDVASDGVDISHSWGELDADAPREEATSCRLAVCNIDWDSVSTSDLFVMLNSFKPAGGVLHSVTIYPSEFGLQRMKEEDAKGPQELVERDEKTSKLEGLDKEHYHREKLRKYQMQRLKYYYAVVECDSADTANGIYEQCDGMEYETSSSRLDLRFVPDDTVFDQEPKEVATEAPDVAGYQPMVFQTTALHQSKVELTWDEDDKKRTLQTMQAFGSKKSMEEMESHIKSYLASSSEEDDSSEEEEIKEEDGDEDECEDGKKKKKRKKNQASEKAKIDMYRSLLKGIEDKEKQTQEDKEMEMEISWEPGLKEATQEIVIKKAESAGSTPWEKYLEKKKEKKKERKEQKKKEAPNADQEGVDAAESYQAFSDDELPEGVDLNDSYFRDSLKSTGKEGGSSKKRRKDVSTEMSQEERDKEKQQKAALELLMLDEEDDGKQHFNLKSIIESENMTKSKRKRQLKQQRKLGVTEDNLTQDSFEIDASDPRFEALFTSHEYAIDPSDTQFKKTKAMSALIEEKQKRRRRKEREEEKTDEGCHGGKSEDVQEKRKKDTDISQLVRSIKSKTEQHHSRKKLKVSS
ncbi:ESF1 homolog [Diadema antillarum]|uniref:ESF1 homolog n=1 Tax=Diadema antillarum TaxID=105358 RepID=UPI003A8A3B7E